MVSQITFEVDLGKEEIQRLDQVLADAIVRDTGDPKPSLPGAYAGKPKGPGATAHPTALTDIEGNRQRQGQAR